MKRIQCRAIWHCRRGGGLSLGIRYHFVVRIRDEETLKLYDMTTLEIGIVFFTIYVNFNKQLT
jgi:hypothetical protein